VPPGGEQLFGPYQGGAHYRVDAIGQVQIAIAPDARVTRQAGMRLLTLNFGPSGLILGPNTPETFIGPEVRIPAGTLHAGDVIWERVMMEFTGTLDTNARGVRCRASSNAGVTTDSLTLSYFYTNFNSVRSVVADRKNVLLSDTKCRSMPNWLFTWNSGSLSSLRDIPDVSNDLYLRASSHNDMTGSSMVIYYYSLWLERL